MKAVPSVVLAAAAAAAVAAPPGPDPATLAFADALRACTPARHGTPHPFVRGFTSEHVVVGEDAGACAYTQSMPGGMSMACAFTEANRVAMAAEIAAAAGGRMSGGTGSRPAWAADCAIVTADGERTPFGG